MPISFAIVFRIFVMLALALHVFYMYCTARTWSEAFGFHVGTSVVAALFGLVMLVPLVWAVTLPEMPEIYTTHWRPHWRWKRGHCPTCGYRMTGLAHGTCPECGAALQPPNGYRITKHTIKLFVVLNISAWLVGCVVAETWLQFDEASFRRESAQQRSNGVANWGRWSRWPANGYLSWRSPDGYVRDNGGMGCTMPPPVAPSK